MLVRRACGAHLPHSPYPPLFLGHGLSYTTFEYSDISVDATSSAPSILISFSVTNSGGVYGKEIAQLYISFPAAAGEPPFQLRDFTSLPLAPGETTQVHFSLNERAYSIWDESAYAWATVPGAYKVSVGASSRDLRLSGSFSI
jgi:beta-glucosidase